jgi:predicted nucleic acid-binding protein
VKTYVFDASALIALVNRKPGALKVNEILKEALMGRAEILMSVVNFSEVYNSLLRNHGKNQAVATIAALRRLSLRLIDATPERALHAAEVKSTYKLYYVDSFAAALALEHKATLVTSDSDFRRLGHGFHVLWLRI